MKVRSVIPGPRYEALVELRRAAEALWNASRIFLVRWDLSPSQFNVLNLLADAPDGISQVELSRHLIMHRSNVTGLVDRLEGRRLVRRGADARDRRVFQVMLTSAGRKLVTQIQPHYYKAAEAVWGSVSAADARRLVAELGRISANAESIARKGSAE